MLSEMGCEVSQRGKAIRLKAPGWKNIARMDEGLATGYSEAEIRAVLAGKKRQRPRSIITSCRRRSRRRKNAWRRLPSYGPTSSIMPRPERLIERLVTPINFVRNMGELLKSKANVDRLLKMDEEQKQEKEKDHDQR